MSEQLDLFRERLPRRPLCTDDFRVGVYHAPMLDAIQSKYIQYNRPKLVAWIVADVDRPGAAYDWYDLGAPPPNITAENPNNKHAHLFYGLEYPVLKDHPEAHDKPMRYAAGVEHGLWSKLGADFGYGNLISKNPLYKGWNVQTYERYLYDLDWLADFVDLPDFTKDRRYTVPPNGLGRNCTLFDQLRRWAYVKRSTIEWPSISEWHATVLQVAVNLNSFAPPLPFVEVKATAKSVAKWVWYNMSYQGLVEVQRRRGVKSGKIRAEKREQSVQALMEFVDENPEATNREIAEALKISERTIRNYRQRTKSDIPVGSGCLDPLPGSGSRVRAPESC